MIIEIELAEAARHLIAICAGAHPDLGPGEERKPAFRRLRDALAAFDQMPKSPQFIVCKDDRSSPTARWNDDQLERMTKVRPGQIVSFPSLGWIPCRDRLPACETPTSTMQGGAFRSADMIVLYADDPKHWEEPGPHISTAFLMDYDGAKEWVYLTDRTGGLEICSSHGGPVPIAWMEVPK